MSPPTLSAFVRSLEAELQSRSAAFDLSDLIRFATDVWALARHDPDPAAWAAAFLEGRRAPAQPIFTTPDRKC
jgi:hypothetical protein